MTDNRLIVLAPQDSVVVVRCGISEGETLIIGDVEIILGVAVSMGHKLALRSVAKGDAILKYGAPIGSATSDILVGEHVHLHNIKSDYTPTYALEGAQTEFEK